MTDPNVVVYGSENDMIRRPTLHYLREVRAFAPKPSFKMRRRTGIEAVRRAFATFNSEHITDIAGTLTYYSLLSMFPALIALVSTLGIFGQGEQTVDEILSLMHDTVPEDTVNFVEGPLRSLATTDVAGFALLGGLLGALWTASAYVGAFGRAVNRIYAVREGRPYVLVKPVQYGVTIVLLVFIAMALLMLTVTGGFAERIFDFIGIGEWGRTLYNWGKWPVIAVILILVVSLLYQLTPNVRQMEFRFLTVGGASALVMVGAAIFGFGFYVSNFGSYESTYGSLAGVIVLMLLLWISNIALLVGALLDAELERGRMLRAGIRSARYIQMPLRSDTNIIKFIDKREELIREAEQIRLDSIAEKARATTTQPT